MPLERTASTKRAIPNAKEKIRIAFNSPNEMRVASQTQRNISGSNDVLAWECYGPRCAVPNSTGRSPSVLQLQLPSLVFLKANDFSIVRR
jgi:hypothetical protein